MIAYHRLAAFGLMLAVAIIAVERTRAEPQLQHQVPPPPGTGLTNPVAAASLDRLSATRERPLFSPSRRPPAPPPVPVVAPPAPPPPPNVTLFGVVMDAEEARAIVQIGPASTIRRVRIGDDIGGWQVAQIEQRRLVLSLENRLATFTMFSKAGNPAPQLADTQHQAGSAPVLQTPEKRDRRGY